MKKIILLFIFCKSFVLFSQETFDKKPVLKGQIWDFSITPNENLWVCSDKSEVLSYNIHSKKWMTWQTEIKNKSFKNIRFFNDSIGVIYGFLKDDGKDFIMRTEDSGKNWSKVDLPNGHPTMWLNSSLLNENGTGIICGTYYVFKTADFGKTWVKLAEFDRAAADESPKELLVVDDKTYFISCELKSLWVANDRFSDVKKAVMPSSHGLVELGPPRSNMSRVTVNKHGVFVETGNDGEVNAAIRNVAQLGTTLYVVQKDGLFCCDASKMNWQKISKKAFIRLAGDGKNLFVIDNKFKVYTIDSDHKLKKYNSKPLQFHPWKCVVHENVLYVLDTFNNEIGIITKDTIEYH